MKIENWSHKRSHKHDGIDGIRVGRIRTFPFLPILFFDSVADDSVKTRFSESEAEEPTVLLPTQMICE